MTAPTEAEIRAEVNDAGAMPKGHPYRKQLHELIDEWAASLRSAAWEALEAEDPRDPDDHTRTAIWRDLRPSEAVVLREAVDEAVLNAASRCEDVILEELVAAGLRFAAEYPDAPRAKVAEPA